MIMFIRNKFQMLYEVKKILANYLALNKVKK